MCDNVSNVNQLLQCQPVCFFNLFLNSSLTSFLNSYTSYLHLVLFQHLSKYLWHYLIQLTIAKKKTIFIYIHILQINWAHLSYCHNLFPLYCHGIATIPAAFLTINDKTNLIYLLSLVSDQYLSHFCKHSHNMDVNIGTHSLPCTVRLTINEMKIFAIKANDLSSLVDWMY